jgi:hypothetical protein
VAVPTKHTDGIDGSRDRLSRHVKNAVDVEQDARHGASLRGSDAR